ncbi:SDR family oxidoreductase [Serratia rhizosphaerae]|uniref:SDR family oxidoreductase n=1 Tax=unclassified Serratia (in: enterobacteria) TaxID=2647522 RepID=UPI000CF6A9EE|nr:MULTISPECIES: SDR family oxidoreductase [unclassified Serratia (in: enterobacteria)]MBU3892501.1 SDR family oxidoreductase [Serratia rubidaea]AVJ17812.1 3-ketoacyl-ACP reductase [Serratia sp. MYb239]MCA4822317.1 SDR family oxidoreductase [Serratia rubidaea]QNK34658.1 SDR family oxidoreductase [Serratia sp. JUb9]CAE1146227.1 3-ketoacyl-ACP reductase [Serratia sp. Tan611]
MSVENKSAIVTGASKGIGRDIALTLARDGFDIVLGFGRDRAAAQAVADEIAALGRKAVLVAGDVAEPDVVASLFSAAQATFGRLDTVVINAGIMRMAPIASASLADFDAMMNVNARSAFLMMAAAGEQLSAGGSIIALSTSVIAKSMPGYGPYIASKLAVEGLVRVMANELRGRDITVNAVAPGPTATELFMHGKSQQQIDALAQAAPLERLGVPQDISEVVAFLAGGQGRWINAQVIRVNGGFA